VLRPRAFGAWQRDYVDLLCWRDLPNWGLHAAPKLTRRLLQMTAAWHGQPWNASQLGRSLGLSYHTVTAYADYLEGAYLVRRLRPYHASIGKRPVKAPKVYLRDSGVLHALLGTSARECVEGAEVVSANLPWLLQCLRRELGEAPRPAAPTVSPG
jgi:uncharacterized protein